MGWTSKGSSQPNVSGNKPFPQRLETLAPQGNVSTKSTDNQLHSSVFGGIMFGLAVRTVSWAVCATLVVYTFALHAGQLWAQLPPGVPGGGNVPMKPPAVPASKVLKCEIKGLDGAEPIWEPEVLWKLPKPPKQMVKLSCTCTAKGWYVREMKANKVCFPEFPARCLVARVTEDSFFVNETIKMAEWRDWCFEACVEEPEEISPPTTVESPGLDSSIDVGYCCSSDLSTPSFSACKKQKEEGKESKPEFKNRPIPWPTIERNGEVLPAPPAP